MPEFRIKVRAEGGWITVLDNSGEILTNAALSPENTYLLADTILDALHKAKIKFGAEIRFDKRKKGKK